MATARSASRAAESVDKVMSEANPQTPLCTTRTDRPSTWLSAVVSMA